MIKFARMAVWSPWKAKNAQVRCLKKSDVLTCYSRDGLLDSCSVFYPPLLRKKNQATHQERPKSAPVGEFPVGSLAEWLMCNHWLLGSPGLPGSHLVVRSPISNLEAYAQSRRSQLIVVSCYTRCLALEGMVLFGGDGLPMFGKILVNVFFCFSNFRELIQYYYFLLWFFVDYYHHLSWLGFRFPFSTFQTQHVSAYVRESQPAAWGFDNLAHGPRGREAKKRRGFSTRFIMESLLSIQTSSKKTTIVCSLFWTCHNFAKVDFSISFLFKLDVIRKSMWQTPLDDGCQPVLFGLYTSIHKPPLHNVLLPLIFNSHIHWVWYFKVPAGAVFAVIPRTPAEPQKVIPNIERFSSQRWHFKIKTICASLRSTCCWFSKESFGKWRVIWHDFFFWLIFWDAPYTYLQHFQTFEGLVVSISTQGPTLEHLMPRSWDGWFPASASTPFGWTQQMDLWCSCLWWRMMLPFGGFVVKITKESTREVYIYIWWNVNKVKIVKRTCVYHLDWIYISVLIKCFDIYFRCV